MTELCLPCVRHELPTNVELFLWYMCASGLGCLMAGLLGVHRLVLDDVHLMALAIVAYLFVYSNMHHTGPFIIYATSQTLH